MPPFVSPAAPHELMPALRVLFGRNPEPDRDRRAERCRSALTRDGHDPAGLFVARDAVGKVCGAVLVQAMPGALGMIWPPRAATPEAEDALVVAACDWLAARGVKVCQAFAAADELPDTAALVRNRFRHVTQLVFLRRDLSPGSPPDSGPTRPLTVTADAPPFSPDFRSLLLETHAGSLDCPELNAGRTPDELIDGFGGALSENEWYLVAENGAPVGVVVLATGVEPGTDDLSYLGVVPSARNRGLGGELLKFAIAWAANELVSVLAVSVDARNEPAMRLYRRHGFAETERREVFLASLGGGVEGW